MATAIQARGLAKEYRIGQFHGGYETLREAIMRAGRHVSRRGDAAQATSIWALRGLDFEVEQGEVVGVIGRNGAGKSTLLRILSRITEPTRGYVDVRGRLGSLLEVGTGFHPELTGRENIFLNGAILGMRRSETRRKFDEIVDFAGVGPFLDTPVKRYSSGMYVRLAFSVAAHLEPEILIVDEVLAVGDAEFQRRCVGKMESIGTSGRTVLFVSHNMSTVARLCPRSILLDGGAVVIDGPTEAVVARYLGGTEGATSVRRWDVDPPGDDYARLREVRVVDSSSTTVDHVSMTQTVGVELTFDLLREDQPVVPMLAVHSSGGALAFNALDPDPRWQSPRRGTHVVTAWIPPNLLNEGEHTISVFLNSITSGRLERHAIAPEALSFLVSNPGESSAKGPMAQVWGGAVSPLLEWAHDVPDTTA